MPIERKLGHTVDSLTISQQTIADLRRICHLGFGQFLEANRYSQIHNISFRQTRQQVILHVRPDGEVTYMEQHVDGKFTGHYRRRSDGEKEWQSAKFYFDQPAEIPSLLQVDLIRSINGCISHGHQGFYMLMTLRFKDGINITWSKIKNMQDEKVTHCFELPGRRVGCLENYNPLSKIDREISSQIRIVQDRFKAFRFGFQIKSRRPTVEVNVEAGVVELAMGIPEEDFIKRFVTSIESQSINTEMEITPPLLVPFSISEKKNNQDLAY